MDFNKFDAVESSNTRKAGGSFIKEQSYENLKYRRAMKKVKQKDGSVKEEIEGRFFVSNAKFKELGLATLGLKQFTAPDGETVIAVVSNEDAVILRMTKKGEKTHNFKSTKLESALEKLKLIDTTKVGLNQYIDLDLVAENVAIKGTSCSKVFTFKAGKEKVKVEKEVAAPVAQASAPVAKPAPAPAVAAVAEDDWK